MKKLLFAVIGIVIFFGCSKKTDVKKPVQLSPKTATMADLNGKWLVQSDTVFSIVNGKPQAGKIETAPNITYVGIFQFNADGTGFVGNGLQAFNYTLSAGLVKLFAPDGQDQGSVTIAGITKSILILRIGDVSTGYTDLYMTRLIEN